MVHNRTCPHLSACKDDRDHQTLGNKPALLSAIEAWCVWHQTRSTISLSGFGKQKLSINEFFRPTRLGRLRLLRSVGLHDQETQRSVGSLIRWTQKMVAGLLELNREVMKFASKGERNAAAAWVGRELGTPNAAGAGYLLTVLTSSLLLHHGCCPRRIATPKRKANYSINVALVIFPHSLRIVESVVGTTRQRAGLKSIDFG